MPSNKPNKPSAAPSTGKPVKTSAAADKAAKLAKARAAVTKAQEGRAAEHVSAPTRSAPSIEVQNVDGALRRVMSAAFAAKGLSAADVDAQVEKHLPKAVERFHKARVAMAEAGAAKRANTDRATKMLRERTKLKTPAPLAPDAPKHLRLAAEVKGKRFDVFAAPAGKETLTVGLAMRAVSKWARKLRIGGPAPAEVPAEPPSDSPIEQ